MRTQREIIKNLVRRYGRQPQPAYYRFWNDDADTLRRLLPPYDAGADSILTPAEMESLGPVERIRDHKEMDIMLFAAMIGKVGLAPARPDTTGMVAMYRANDNTERWALELFRRAQ